MPRVVGLVLTTAIVAAACASEPTDPGDVVGAWAEAAMVGDAETAQTYIASNDIPWIGLGNSPEAFAAGGGPYEVTNLFVECTSDHTLGRCEVWWNDLWIDAIPELSGLEDRGDAMLRMTGEVEDGKIVAFREWVLAPELVRANQQHVDWLELYEPEKLAAACDEDSAAAPCSQLLVDTVHQWVDGR